MGCAYNRVPAPRGLVLERQLAASAVFTWQPPAPEALRAGAHELLAYHVCVNGHFRLAVNATATPTRAFIDRIDFSKVIADQLPLCSLQAYCTPLPLYACET